MSRGGEWCRDARGFCTSTETEVGGVMAVEQSVCKPL